MPWDSDTDFTPYDWQTVASRFTVMGGNAVIEAARECLDQIRAVAGQALGVPAEEIECGDGQVWVRGKPDEEARLQPSSCSATPSPTATASAAR